MKLASVLEGSRAELLHLQQRLIDDLPDDIDVNIVELPNLGMCLGLTIAGKLIRAVRPSTDPQKIAVASHQDQHWSIFSYDGVVRLTARSSKLLEAQLDDRASLLTLQQRLIDDLPDEVNVDLVHNRLGNVICIATTPKKTDGRSYPTKRFVKPSNRSEELYYAPNEYTSLQPTSYDSFIHLVNCILS